MNVADHITAWLRNYLVDNDRECFVVGVSGGVDSAVVSTLCAQTGVSTIVLNMPIDSTKTNTELSITHCDWLAKNFKNVRPKAIDLGGTFTSFKSDMLQIAPDDELACANTKSRIRMMALYYVAAAAGGIVVGTGNKVEDFGVGFYTKYGDGGVDISPIADLTKTEVRQLASTLGVRNEIIEAPPTDGLWEDSRTDEEQIGASYEELEWVMQYLRSSDSQQLTARQQSVLKIYQEFHNKNKHKMEPIPVFDASPYQEKV